MKPLTASLILSSGLLLDASAATAQPPPRVAVSASVGVAADSGDTGLTGGGALLVDVSDRVSLEGQGAYLDRGDGASAFSAGGSVLVNLRPASDPTVPYIAAGVGVYHASFDLDRPRFLGPVGTQFGPGMAVCPGPGTGFGMGMGPGFGGGRSSCPADTAGYWGVGALPAFYARRLGTLAFPHGGAWGARSFTDPAVNIGAGLRFNVSDRLMVRPDARVLVVLAEGKTHTLGVFTVHVGYRF